MKMITDASVKDVGVCPTIQLTTTFADALQTLNVIGAVPRRLSRILPHLMLGGGDY